MVYLIVARASKSERFAKIGYSKNPEQRLKELQYMCPLKLRLVCTMPGTQETEKALHRYFEEYRVPHTNEWFKVGKELKEIVDYWFSSKTYPKSVAEFVYSNAKQKSIDRLRNLFPETYKKVFT